MVSIRISNSVTDINNSEYSAAVCLKENLKESISESVNGNISIAYGLTLTGQEVRDIDILVVGQLDNYIIPDSYTNNPQYAKKPLKVDSFCIAIELKEHPAHRISFQGTHVLVEYQGQMKDATAQNEKQRYSLLFKDADMITKSEDLRKEFEEGFVKDCQQYKRARLFVACGQGVYDELMKLKERGVITAPVVAIAHPSGNNGVRVLYYMGQLDSSLVWCTEKAKEAIETICQTK